jgi:enoyl-[acyl-carrier protein] reductase II
MGCQAVWVGTRFLATEEAGIAGWMKAELVAAGDQSPIISRSYTGKRFRMLPNEWTKAWEEAPIDPLPMPLQPVLVMQTLGGMAGAGSNRALTQNGAGNIAGLIEKVVPAAEVVHSMADEARELLGGWSWQSTRPLSRSKSS